MTERIVRGRILTFRDDPRLAGARAWRLIDDGAVAIEDGLIAAVGEARDILAAAPKDAAIDDHSGKLVLPGLIDAHIHYPQTRVIGSYGAQLLDWLNKYTFVEEQKFADPAHSAAVARFFLDELWRRVAAAHRQVQRLHNPASWLSPRPGVTFNIFGPQRMLKEDGSCRKKRQTQ